MGIAGLVRGNGSGSRGEEVDGRAGREIWEGMEV